MLAGNLNGWSLVNPSWTHNPLEDQHANLIQILQTNMNIQKFESVSVDVTKIEP